MLVQRFQPPKRRTHCALTWSRIARQKVQTFSSPFHRQIPSYHGSIKAVIWITLLSGSHLLAYQPTAHRQFPTGGQDDGRVPRSAHQPASATPVCVTTDTRHTDRITRAEHVQLPRSTRRPRSTLPSRRQSRRSPTSLGRGGVEGDLGWSGQTLGRTHDRLFTPR